MKFTWKKSFLLAIIFFGLNLSAVCQTFYVSTEGSDSNPGTLNSPWKTIQKAIDMVTAGQTVIIRGGIYSQYLVMSNSGTSGNPISFLAYPDEIPVIDGSSKIGVDVHLVKILGSYVTLRGLEVRNSSGAGIAIFGGNYIILDSLHVHNCHGSGVGAETSYNTISNCSIHDVFDWASGGGNSDGIHFSAHGGNTPPYENVGYNTVRNNLIYNCSDDGIDTWSSRGNIIEGNIVNHTGFTNAANGYPGTIGQPAGDGNGFKCGGGGEAGQNIVRNNLSYANRTSGFDGNSGILNKFYNNTAYSNPIGFRALMTDYSVINNLANSNPKPYEINGGTPVSMHHNSWNLNITNPAFVTTDPASSDFLKLSSTSPALNVGADLTSEGITVDRIGVTRPQDSGFDLGAYEYDGNFCEGTYIISPTAFSPGIEATTGNIDITTGSGCSWTAVSNAQNWLTVATGASGKGNGTVSFAVTANPGVDRTGTITVAWQTFTVNQSGNGCIYTIFPESITYDTEVSTSGSIAVTANRTDCAWTAVSNSTNWLTLTSGENGTGNGTVEYTVTANPGADRTGTITVAGATYIVNQPASSTAKVIVLLTDLANGNDEAQYTWLTENGFVVTRINIGSGGVDFKDPGQAIIDQMNAADLVIVGRNPNSNLYSGTGMDVLDNITAPVIYCNPFGAQWGNPKFWFADATVIEVLATDLSIDVTDDPIFANSHVNGGILKYADTSLGTITGAGTHNGNVIGTHNGNIVIVRFTANVAYYESGNVPKSDRTIFAMNEFLLTEDGKSAYLAEINRLISIISGINSKSPSSSIVSVYPNPFNSNSTLKISSQIRIEDAFLIIYDMNGKEVKMITVEKNETPVSMDGLKSGIYVFRIFNNGEAIGHGKLNLQ